MNPNQLIGEQYVPPIVPQAMSSKCSKGSSGPAGDEVANLVAQLVAPNLTANPYADNESREGLLVAHALRGEGHDASEDGTGRGTPLIAVAPTLRAGANKTGGDRPPGTDVDTADSLIPIAFHGTQDPDVSGDVAHPMGTNQGQETAIAFRRLFGWKVRRLTPRECCRLQGFPDDYFDGVIYRKKRPADGPIYKGLGNSMPTNVMRVLGERIALVDALP